MDPAKYLDRNRKPIEIGQRVKVRATRQFSEHEFEGTVVGKDRWGQVIVEGPEYSDQTIHGKYFTTNRWYMGSSRYEDGYCIFDTEDRVFRLDCYDMKRNWIEVING